MAPLVGNDVVHTDDPSIARHHLDSRWRRRVFASSERMRIDHAATPGKLAWSMFAAKEAAFKVVVKLRPGTVFAHRRFVVSPDSGSVQYEDLTLPLLVEVERDCVHAVVTCGALPRHAMTRLARPPAPFCPSAAVRQHARAMLAAHLGTPASKLEIKRDPRPERWDRQGPPYLVEEDNRLPIDLSLSHDGPFVACAALYAEAIE